MGLIYAFRLGSFLFIKRVLHKPEDSRYHTIRAKLGAWESVGIFSYFQVQVPASLFFAGLPCWIMSHPADGLRWLDGLGVLIFLIANLGEHLADQQLARFRENSGNSGKTLQTGLWRYSRHPNYFFEKPTLVGLCAFGYGSPLVRDGNFLAPFDDCFAPLDYRRALGRSTGFRESGEELS